MEDDTMNNWEKPTVEEVELSETKFGPNNQEVPDGEWEQVIIDGIVGWRQPLGDNKPSGNN